MLRSLLAACGAFLAGVVWMDLMFDVQVLGQAAAPAALPESVVASIAAYYRRVTTDADPMRRLIGLVMVVAVLGALWTATRPRAGALDWVAVLLALAPIALAGARVFPNAVRLGARTGSLLEQSVLARGICRDHLVCFAAIAGFAVLQVLLAAQR